MLEGLSDKFKRIKMPEESLIKKIEKLKNSSKNETPDSDDEDSTTPDITEQLKKTEEELTQKVQEEINKKAEQIDANAEALKEFEAQLSKIEGSVSSSKHQVDEFKERLDKIDENLLELLSLYEVVSSTVNPFVSDKEGHSEKIEEIEQKIDELSHQPADLPEETKEQYNIKFKALEGSLEALTEMLESSKLDQEALIESVSEKVLENIKPFIEQMSIQNNNNGSSTEDPGEETFEDYQEISPSVPETRSSRNGNSTKLAHLDNRAETSIYLLNWIEFLMEKVGRNNLHEVLEYYIEIGWISEEVSKKMMTFANGIDYYVERPTWKLLPEDHTKSLMFIEQLTGRKIDKHMLSKLERDVEKVIKPELYSL